MSVIVDIIGIVVCSMGCGMDCGMDCTQVWNLESFVEVSENVLGKEKDI